MTTEIFISTQNILLKLVPQGDKSLIDTFISLHFVKQIEYGSIEYNYSALFHLPHSDKTISDISQNQPVPPRKFYISFKVWQSNSSYYTLEAANKKGGNLCADFHPCLLHTSMRQTGFLMTRLLKTDPFGVDINTDLTTIIRFGLVSHIWGL